MFKIKNMKTTHQLSQRNFIYLCKLIYPFSFFFLFPFFNFSYGQNNPPIKQWAFNDGGTLHPKGFESGEDWFYSGIETSDGNYVGTGYMELDPVNHHGAYSVAIVKLNPNMPGKRIWERSFQFNLNDIDYGIDIVENSNGHYVILAAIFDVTNSIPFYQVLEYDKDGNQLNVKDIIDGNSVLHGGGYGSIRKIMDGGSQSGYIIGCADLAVATSHTQINAQATLIRLDNNFNLVTSFGTGGIAHYSNTGSNCRTASVLHNSNGTLAGFLLVGREKNGSVNNDFDALAIKTSTNGTVVWNQTFSENILGTSYTDAITGSSTCTCSTTASNADACPENASWEAGFSGDEISFGGDIILNLWFDYRSLFQPPNCSNAWLSPQSWQDLDVALLRVSASTGSLTGTNQTIDIAHFSGIDFLLQ